MIACTHQPGDPAAMRASLLTPRVEPDAATLFTNVRVWSAGLDAPTAAQSVLVVGNRIAAVGAGVETAPAKAVVVDGDGRVIMPGLIDGHAHLSFHDITRLEDGKSSYPDPCPLPPPASPAATR